MSRRSVIIKLTRKSLAALISVWLSGVVFLFCCAPTIAATDDAHAAKLTEMANECPMAKSHKAEAESVASVESCCLFSCELLPAVLDRNRKVETSDQRVAAPVKYVSVNFDITRVTSPVAPPVAEYSRIIYQNDLSIRNCVFRI